MLARSISLSCSHALSPRLSESQSGGPGEALAPCQSSQAPGGHSAGACAGPRALARGRAGGSSSPGHSAASVPVGLLGSPGSQYETLCQSRGGPQSLETIRAQALGSGRPFGHWRCNWCVYVCLFLQYRSARGRVQWGCEYATALNIEVDPQRRRFGRRESTLLHTLKNESPPRLCRVLN